ncbi:MAG: DUF5674 family protein [Patescibacteria group bacterium]|mgnify:CR=1 FL=1
MIKIVTSPMTKEELKESAHETFVSLVKAVVDIEREIMAIGGELHADEEAILIENGSKNKNLWGINIHLNEPENEWIEFDSMINLKPALGNRSRSVENAEIQEKIKKVVSILTK